MAITSSMFTIAAGAINRSRPLVYGTEADPSLRKAGKSQGLFMPGILRRVRLLLFLQHGFSRIFILIQKLNLTFGLWQPLCLL